MNGVEFPENPEAKCGRCGGRNIVWSAPSPLWNMVMRGGTINGVEPWGGIVCPICFAELAEKKNVADLWRVHAERIHVDLETVTPSGRVWNASTWKFDEPTSGITFGTDEKTGTTTRFEDGSKAGACWGPGVEGYWYAYRDDIAAGTLRFGSQEDAEKYLKAEVSA